MCAKIYSPQLSLFLAMEVNRLWLWDYLKLVRIHSCKLSFAHSACAWNILQEREMQRIQIYTCIRLHEMILVAFPGAGHVLGCLATPAWSLFMGPLELS